MERYEVSRMEFRTCIDIHNGKVKQIVGGSLQDQGDRAKENFVAEQDASFYAEFYKKDCIQGGHVILLNSRDSEYYEKTKEQAMQALKAYPGGLQIGGGICAEKPVGYDLADYVLGHFTGDDKYEIENAKKRAADAAVMMICGDAEKAMNEFNRKV